MSDIGTKRAALSIQGVSVIYRSGLRRRRALSDVSVSVDTGSTFGLIGPNGAGKSTLLRCVVGLLRPDAGTIRLDGYPPMRPRSRRRVGYVPDRLGHTSRQTGYDYLGLHARLLGTASDPSVHDAADRFGMRDYWHRPMRDYSRGMLQKTGLAAATLGQPAILVLDEPTAGLDPDGIRQLRRMILSHRRRGGTALVSSHHLDELARICDRVAILTAGRIRRRLDIRELKAASRFIVELATEPGPDAIAALSLPGGLVERVDGRTVRLRLDGTEAAETIVRCFVQAGFPVRGARFEEPDLERFVVEGEGD